MFGIPRRNRGLFLAIVVAAFAVRLAYVIDIADSPYFKYPQLDSYWYDAKAKDVVGGDVLAKSASFRSPLYVYMLAACYLVFGPGPVAPAVIQSVLGALMCGIVFVIGLRLFGRVAAAVAGFGLAFYRMAIYSDGEMLPSTVYVFFLLLAVYYLLETVDRTRVRDSLLAGLFLGLAFLTRAEAVLTAAGVLAVVWAATRRKRGFRLALPMGIVLAGMTALLGLRNQAAYGDFYVVSPHGALNLYVGNAWFSDGMTPVAPPTTRPYELALDPREDSIEVGCKQAALDETGRALSGGELSRYYTRKTLAEVTGNPSRWARLVGKKIYYSLNSYERSDIKFIPRIIEKHSRVLRLPLATYAWAMPLGVVGAALAAGRRVAQALALIAPVLAAGLVPVVFFVIWRLRLPVVPLLAVLGGYAVAEMAAAVKAGRWGLLAKIGLPALLLGGLSVTRFLGVGDERALSNHITNEAQLFATAGRLDEAVRTYREAIAVNPLDARAHFYLGKALGSLGQIDESRAEMEEAGRIRPSFRPYVDVSVGILHANRGEFAQASEAFGRALEADPDFGLAWYNLGLSLFSLGRFTEAEAALSRAQDLLAGDHNVVLSVGQIFVDMGNPARGIGIARDVLRADPANAKAFFTLGLGLAKLGKTDEAIAEFEQALRLEPSSSEVRQELLRLRADRTPR